MTKRDIATDYFKQGYNCAQAVLLAFKDETGLTTEQSAMIASSFGGGMGKLREVCGAVSGMLMAAGLIFGYSNPADQTAKSEHYANVQNLAKLFKEKNGSLICRELLSGVSSQNTTLTSSELSSDTPPSVRTPEYYKKRPCGDLVGDAAEILEKYITTNIRNSERSTK